MCNTILLFEIKVHFSLDVTEKKIILIYLFLWVHWVPCQMVPDPELPQWELCPGHLLQGLSLEITHAQVRHIKIRLANLE